MNEVKIELKTPMVEVWKKGHFVTEITQELAQDLVNHGMYKVMTESAIEWISPYSRNGGHDGARI